LWIGGGTPVAALIVLNPCVQFKAVEINPLYKTVKEVDEDGNATERQEIVYNDFHTLNADEIYKAMYGALQLAIQRIEMLEKKVNA
jgi:hypothetical protein